MIKIKAKKKKLYTAPKISSKKINLEAFFTNRSNSAWGDWEMVQLLASSSDMRLKKHIKHIDDPNILEKFQKVKVASFQWNKKAGKYLLPQNKNNIGFIAQELEKVFPELVLKDNYHMRKIDYGRIVSMLVMAVQKLNRRNDELKKRVEYLELKKN